MDYSISETGQNHFPKGGLSQSQKRMANSVDQEETAHDKPFHQDLHCLQKELFWSAELKDYIALRRPQF